MIEIVLGLAIGGVLVWLMRPRRVRWDWYDADGNPLPERQGQRP